MPDGQAGRPRGRHVQEPPSVGHFSFPTPHPRLTHTPNIHVRRCKLRYGISCPYPRFCPHPTQFRLKVSRRSGTKSKPKVHSHPHAQHHPPPPLPDRRTPSTPIIISRGPVFPLNPLISNLSYPLSQHILEPAHLPYQSCQFPNRALVRIHLPIPRHRFDVLPVPPHQPRKTSHFPFR